MGTKETSETTKEVPPMLTGYIVISPTGVAHAVDTEAWGDFADRVTGAEVRGSVRRFEAGEPLAEVRTACGKVVASSWTTYGRTPTQADVDQLAHPCQAEVTR